MQKIYKRQRLWDIARYLLYMIGLQCSETHRHWLLAQDQGCRSSMEFYVCGGHGPPPLAEELVRVKAATLCLLRERVMYFLYECAP